MKTGLDYFPLDTVLDSKWELIEAEFGLIGFGVVVHILQDIYRGEGYYIEWTEEVALLFSRRYAVGGNAVSEIVNAALRRGLFDKGIFDQYRILTSKAIQKRYFKAIDRRKDIVVDDRVLMVNLAEFFKNVNIKHKNANISDENADISKQSKGKESKVKESKEHIGTEPQAPSVLSVPLLDGTEFDIFQSDIDEWQEAFPAVDVAQELKSIRLWCKDNPKKRKTRKGARRFISGWLERKQNRGGSRSLPQQTAPAQKKKEPEKPVSWKDGPTYLPDWAEDE